MKQYRLGRRLDLSNKTPRTHSQITPSGLLTSELLWGRRAIFCTGWSASASFGFPVKPKTQIVVIPARFAVVL